MPPLKRPPGEDPQGGLSGPGRWADAAHLLVGTGGSSRCRRRPLDTVGQRHVRGGAARPPLDDPGSHDVALGG